MSMRAQLALLALMGGMGGLPAGPRRITYGELLGLRDEYNLIMDKKSKLTRGDRDGIIDRVERLCSRGKLIKHDDGTVSISPELD